MKLFNWMSMVYLCPSVMGFFLHRPLHIRKISARQDECASETVVFNSNFVEFMLAFLGIDETQCGCDEPCPSVDRFVKLYIYRTDTNSFQKLYPNGSNAHLIDRNKPTTVFVHGYSDSFRPSRNAWNNQMLRLESRILKRNTIALDWGKLSRCSYTYATEVFIPKIGYFLHRALSEVLKLNLRSVNCVGHSLGAHICGYAGAASGGQFDRCFAFTFTRIYQAKRVITNNNRFYHCQGLDPAGIGYSSEYFGPPRGLNSTCCQYVQAIHSDALIGSKQQMGHVDFYPNNSTGLQPHCIIQSAGCSHSSVVEYYKAALDPRNMFVGGVCEDVRSNANCRFGPHTDVDCHGVACFDTSPCAPFTI